MGQSEKHGAKGRMHLQKDWEESSSTHVESHDDFILEASADGASIVLIHKHGTQNFINSKNTDYKEERVILSVQKLIQLIRENGKKNLIG